jgi:hypothetical protein
LTGKALLLNYIKKRIEKGELTRWEFLLCGLQRDGGLGSSEILPGVRVYPIERGRELMAPKRMTRISNLSEGKDEHTAATQEERAVAAAVKPKPIGISNGKAYRQMRDSTLGRVFIYPISKFSNHPEHGGSKGVPLFMKEDLDKVPDCVMAFGISLPGSASAINEAMTEYTNESVG